MSTNYVYKGAIKELLKLDYKKPLVFCGKKSFEKNKPIFEKYVKNPVYYNDFSTNPKIEDIKKANCFFKDNFSFDLIIAIGGGSVIDFAKIFKFENKLNLKFIALPTTAGTGSEVTQFAVYYENGIKKSLDDISILPDIAIADSQFVEDNPRYLKAATALDAYSQAIESYFAVKSTDESRKYAKEAIELCRDNIVEYVNSNDEKFSKNMMLASNLSGRAINISRTTACHAMSYSITTKYGLPHGHAVALNIGRLMEYNKKVDKDTLNDNRGVDFVKARMDEIYSLIGIKNAVEYFSDIFEKIGIEKIDFEIDYIDPERLKNNPRKLDLAEFFAI